MSTKKEVLSFVLSTRLRVGSSVVAALVVRARLSRSVVDGPRSIDRTACPFVCMSADVCRAFYFYSYLHTFRTRKAGGHAEDVPNRKYTPKYIQNQPKSARSTDSGGIQ